VVGEDGNVGFLMLQGGVIARLEGSASMRLVESRRQVDAPSVLQGLLAQRGGDPIGKTKVTTALALDVLSGTVGLKTGEARANATSKLQAANLYSPVQGATVQVTVQPEAEVLWDTLEGEPVLGMVSGPAGQEAPVVIPQPPRGLRLAIPIPPEATRATEGYRRYDESMREMVALVARGEASLKAGGLDYQEFTDPSGLFYLAGVEQGEPKAQQTFATESVEAPLAEEVVAVPGLEVREITDAEIQSALPAGLSVHLLPGNTLRLTLGRIPYTVRASVVGGRLELQGLPLGLDPSGYFGELPALLSLETAEGVARVTYLPEEPPPPPQETAAEQIIEEGALPHTSPFFSAIPTPLQVSLDWNVATTNLLIVALLALVLRVSVASSTHILSAQEALLKRKLDPILRWWRPIADAMIKLLHKIPHLVTTIAGNIIFLLVVNGLLFAFLDIRFKPWAGAGLQIFPLMLLGTAAAGMIDPIVRARVMNRWKEPHSFGFNPANMFLGAVCVSVSRLLSLSPGIIMGSAGGLRTPTLKSLPLARRSSLVMSGVIGTGAVGLGAWFATLLLPLAASVPLTAGLVQLLRGPLSTIQDVCLLAFTGCLTKAFFQLLPVPNSPGLTVASKNLIGWSVSFLVSGFLFFHLILNKNTGITKLLQERGYILVPLVVISLVATMALYFASKVMAKRAAAKS
ncbi:MAG: hypothetical protein AAB303_02385, partial [Chloroflexota bacterium]